MPHRIQGIRLEIVNRSNGESQSKYYVPILDVEGDVASSERLVEWLGETKARGFIEWLRDQLPRNNPKPQRALAGRF